ncbi:DUF2092 domain-containing protein [Amantichitinum ursilacus]|uniref:DUF2092 domain-containing protein n=1 Tax=Amantichitinum ursilacus TaxID=857265 RepID=A0A0N0XJD2_9NEIS|nr:DUF2092 domain-containing protein [Amantichitinum ursilacus]KPC50648.1 hypothetical protein WG78_16380 [Amantichitinum ursilacus]
MNPYSKKSNAPTRTALALAALLVTAGAAWADTPVNVDPQATQALAAMGTYLRTLQQFTVSADSTTDVVDDAGQTLQFANQTELNVQRPNHLQGWVKGDEGTRSLYYDGSTFTLHGSENNFYASVPAPATIAELVADLSGKYGLETPLADLFYWGQGEQPELTSAQVIGEERLAGQICTHYAFRQPGVDWQVWIRKGAQPLPCKLSIIDAANAARPQHTATLKWQLQPHFSTQTFHFVPPAGARRIVLRPLDASAPAATPAQ